MPPSATPIKPTAADPLGAPPANPPAPTAIEAFSSIRGERPEFTVEIPQDPSATAAAGDSAAVLYEEESVYK